MIDPKEFHATESKVREAIETAKNAARRVGIDATPKSKFLDPDEAATEAMHIGRTSFAFELKGLENAAAVGEIEEALSALNGVSVRIVYSSSMAWITASRSTDITMIEEVFSRFGITATLSDSSLRRRLAWSDVEEGRYNRSHQRHRRRRRRELSMPSALRRQAAEESKALELARREGFLDGTFRTLEHKDPTDVLFTARTLITPLRLIVTVLFTIPVIAISYIPSLQFDYWQWVLAALAFPVVTYGAYPFHRATIGGFRRGMSALDSASSLAIMVAYFYSLAVMVYTEAGDPQYRVTSELVAIDPMAFESGALFFDVACAMTLFLLGGRLLSRKTRKNLVDELADCKPLPQSMATRVVKSRKTGEVTEKNIHVHKLNVGDDIVVPPYGLIPVDGQVVGGSSHVDGRALGIGEHEVKVNSKVYAGCMNGANTLKIRVLSTGHRTWLAALSRWVDKSSLNQNHSDALATKSASVLVPIALAIAMLDFTLWALITNNINQAIATSLAVLGCVAPVALAVSSSVAMRQGIEMAARHGVLIRDADTVRTLDFVDTIIFNRVGALSVGEMTVESVTADRGENPDLVLRVASALTLESDHPVSRALKRAARESRDASTDDTIPRLIDVSNVEIDENGSFTGLVEIPLRDSDGRVELRNVEAKLWRPRNLSDVQGRLAAAAVSGGTPLVVRWKGKDRGVITLHDDAKDDATRAVADVEQLGIETMMLSRDTYPVARRYGDMVGVSHVLAGIQPGHKAQTVRSVHNHGAVVAMVGDDSVRECFRVANVGILVDAMGSLPSASALENTQADVVLLTSNTEPIPWLFKGARRLNKLISSNLFLAWGYNLVAILAACAGVLHPMFATILMLGSSLVIESRSSLARTFSSS
ncbi:HAD family hydrolase [Corynebacterium felinum]|uniref:Cation transport ATPase n=1 Tax=Corynebacterium felinum TaxID=131318 RepID=A0ABU2B7G7_9CORY|nr:HAD family hydrolase [Corynebacterium felinum]MDF5819961.1 HAD family hydrolase [Corynebacterium felinum]MDR7354552.1 cation transport ATPase [Corynebacterium felinum]WJY93919.1 putative copper-exporting P-type ATPase V [Corynebacterium felinum]